MCIVSYIYIYNVPILFNGHIEKFIELNLFKYTILQEKFKKTNTYKNTFSNKKKNQSEIIVKIKV